MSKLRTDFGKVKRPGKLCSCCSKVGTHKCTRQVSWFRGDDDVYLLCDEHLAAAKEGKWQQLNDALANENTRRKSISAKP